MGFLSETPGQLKAVAYLDQMIGIGQRKVRIGGHSKGGNLAVYASVKCRPYIKKKIEAVYSNDGPGFSRKMVESEEYQEMLPKIKTILPESSVVGMLLEHEEDFEVVKSSNNGLMQHDSMSWEVLGTKFIPAGNLAVQSILLDETMKNWLRQLDIEQRQQIVETAFSLLEELNIHTVDDFYHSKWKVIQEVLKSRSKLSPEVHKVFSESVKLLWKTGNSTVKQMVKEKIETTKEQKTKI